MLHMLLSKLSTVGFGLAIASNSVNSSGVMEFKSIMLGPGADSERCSLDLCPSRVLDTAGADIVRFTPRFTGLRNDENCSRAPPLLDSSSELFTRSGQSSSSSTSSALTCTPVTDPLRIIENLCLIFLLSFKLRKVPFLIRDAAANP